MATEKMLKLFNSFGFLVHYLSITRGVLDLRDIIFFASFDSVFLFAPNRFNEFQELYFFARGIARKCASHRVNGGKRRGKDKFVGSRVFSGSGKGDSPCPLFGRNGKKCGK